MSDPIQTGAVIAERYRLGDVLGRSLMSEVYRGEDLRLKRSVAIKVLRGDADPNAVARFEREAQILARLRHPNIVVVFDTGTDGADRFIVMELVEGPTLRQHLDDASQLPVERATEIGSLIASALAAAHAHGIVHRDVKPSNVLLPVDGGLKLVDMGIARLLSAEALTLTMTALGTARYMSPEQAGGGPLDGRSDIYSLGCVLFEMLTGRTPFQGNPVALSYAHTHTPAPRVRSINPAAPASMDDLVAAMLEKDPADRPQTAEDVERALAAVVSRALAQTAPTPPVAPPPPPSPAPGPSPGERRGPRTSAWPTAIGALSGLIALILLIALLGGAGRDDRTTASARSPHRSGSPDTREPSSADTGSPAPGQPTPLDAAAAVRDVLAEGVQAGEIHGDVVKDIDHSIDEMLRETEKGEDVEHSLEKIGDLQEKVSEAREKGEITTDARASAINDALATLAEALQGGSSA